MGYKAFYSIQEIGIEPWKFLEQMIEFYCELPEPKILDATVNEGRIWGRGKCRYKYTGMDIDPSVHPDIVADNTKMPLPDGSFDIIVYDPPHTGDQGKSRTGFGSKYGTTVLSRNEKGVWGNLFHTYPAFLAEAQRVLRDEGWLMVKLIDCTHAAKFQFATAEFYNAAQKFGFELFGLHYLPRKGVITDSKWKKAYHPRQNHCTWMVFKKFEDKK